VVVVAIQLAKLPTQVLLAFVERQRSAAAAGKFGRLQHAIAIAVQRVEAGAQVLHVFDLADAAVAIGIERTQVVGTGGRQVLRRARGAEEEQDDAEGDAGRRGAVYVP
jgi:hypothetical protein